MNLNYDEKVNIITVGDSTVGKTSIINLYFEEKKITNYLATVGIEHYSKNIQLGNKLVKLKVWDTAGQERFRSLTKNYFKNADGVIVVYDVSNRNSFNNIKTWISSINENKSEDDIKVIIVGNKIDLQREVSFEEGKKAAGDYGFDYLESSAKNNTGVEEIFRKITIQVLSKTMDVSTSQNGDLRLTMKNIPNKNEDENKFNLNNKDEEEKKGCGC